MRRFAPLFIILFVQLCFAQVLSPRRITQWNPGNQSWTEKTIINDVLEFGAVGDGETDDTQAFKDAINDLPSRDGELYIPEGVYLLTETLDINKAILIRGDGAARTKIFFDLSEQNINCIRFSSYNRGSFVDVSGGIEKGSTELIVNYANAFKGVEFIEIMQDNDPELMYTQEDWKQSWAEDAVGQILRVSHVKDDTVFLSTPLHLDYNMELNPRIRKLGMLKNMGMQDLYMERVDAGDGHTISITQAADARIQDIESAYTYRSHIYIESSIGCLIRRNYIHHAHDYGGGGHGYGIDTIRHTSDCLITDNIFEHLRHSMMTHVGTSGNVFSYNFSVEREPGKLCDVSLHGHYSNHNLIESNVVHEIDISDYWGPIGPGNTIFRNRVMSEGININDHSHGQNIVANIIQGGALAIKSNVDNTIKHGNRIRNKIYWDADIDDHECPNSYYLDEKPDFFGDLPWPVFGPEIEQDRMIPAEYRYHGIDPSKVELHNVVPKQFKLSTFPNPFNPNTTIQFELEQAGEVNISLFTITGRQADHIFSGTLPGGVHQIQYQPKNLASGVYLLQLKSQDQSMTRKITFQK